jgi:hypothetical protein
MQAMRIPKQGLLTIGVAASTSLLITGIALHHNTPKTTHLALNNSSIIQPTKPTMTVTSTSAIPATLGSSTTTYTSTNSPAAPAPTSNQKPPSDPSNNPTTPVTPVSAKLSDWQNDNVSEIFVGGAHDGQSLQRQRQYCVYTYSNSSTQQRTYALRYIWSDGTIEPDTKDAVTPFDCSINTAP